jgi:hypothetical protein
MHPQLAGTKLMDNGLLTVRDAAVRLGVIPRTLKYYEEYGLGIPIQSETSFQLISPAASRAISSGR